MLYYVVTGVLFLVNAIQDIRTKKVNNVGLAAGAGIVLVLLVLDSMELGPVPDLLLSAETPWKRLWGILPGVAVLAFSYLSRGSIGKGDGYLLCAGGAALGLQNSTAVLLYGLMSAGVTAGVLLALRKVRKNTELPFVPFLLLGFLFVLLQS